MPLRADSDIKRDHPLATEDGLKLFVDCLLYMGAMCPKCAHGTRATKRWARCKKCGVRVERRVLPESEVRMTNFNVHGIGCGANPETPLFGLHCTCPFPEPYLDLKPHCEHKWVYNSIGGQMQHSVCTECGETGPLSNLSNAQGKDAKHG